MDHAKYVFTTDEQEVSVDTFVVENDQDTDYLVHCKGDTSGSPETVQCWSGMFSKYTSSGNLYLQALLPCECTGLPVGWTDVTTDVSFPVPHNTAITVSCPTGYELGGDTTVTCDEDEKFTYTTAPSCTEKSKSLVDST